MSVAAIAREFLELPLSLIDEPALPSRSSMDDQKMDDLAESIRANGLLQPMVVARTGERYEVIAGHRRWHASTRAGLEKVPCIVYPSKSDALLVVQAHENARREDLNAADEAIWFMELLEQHCGGDIEKLCALVGEKLNYVDNRIALFRGDADVFKALQTGQIKIGVAHELNKCSDAHWRRYYLDCAIRGGATIAVVDGWIREWKQNIADQPQAPQPVAAEEPGIAETAHNPFTCVICGKADNAHLIRQLNIHQHCDLAILRPLLASARGES